MSSNVPPQSVLYFSYAVMFNIDKLQQNTDKSIAVKFPPSTYVDFATYTKEKGDIKKDSSKAKIMTAEPGAVTFITKMFDIVGDRVMYFGPNYASFDEFIKHDSAATIMNDFKDLELDSEFLTAEVKDIINQLETSYNTKVTSNKAKKIPKDLCKGMFNGFIRFLYAASKFVAATVIFSTAKTTSKYTDIAVRSALLTIYDGAEKDDIYKLFSFCGNAISPKEVHVVAPKKPAGDKKTTTSGSKTKPQNSKEHVSDNDDEEQADKPVKPKKNTRTKPKKPEIEDESSSDSESDDSGDSDVEQEK